jgi:hypothetical protein
MTMTLLMTQYDKWSVYGIGIKVASQVYSTAVARISQNQLA